VCVCGLCDDVITSCGGLRAATACTLYFQKLELLAYISVAACMGLHSTCIFIQICAVGSKRRIFSAPECVLAVQGRSGSSKVDDFWTNRKRVYDFLLVGHCHYGPILHRFRQIASKLSSSIIIIIIIIMTRSSATAERQRVSYTRLSRLTQ